MSLDVLVEKIVKGFREDPRNKVFVSESVLLASVEEEAGEKISTEQIRSIISKYQEGKLEEGEEEEKYDAAVYACSVVARMCFGDDPEDEDEEVDYEISWLEEDGGEYTAEIRPN